MRLYAFHPVEDGMCTEQVAICTTGLPALAVLLRTCMEYEQESRGT